MRAHHRRRLTKLGWEHALEPTGDLWCQGEPPPRPGNAIEILVDGAEVIPRLLEALRQARSHVHYAGWYLDPDFRLTREESPLIVRDFFAELAEEVDVRVLLWGGAPLPPPFRPARGHMEQIASELSRGTKVKVARDSRERPLHCHHEKVVVVDDEVAFVGGMDLTHFAGDRYDTPDHVARAATGWHDCSSVLRGPIVGDVADHFRFRWQEVAKEPLPPPEPAAAVGDVELQLVRTVPEKIYDSLPRGDFRVLEAYTRSLRSAERLVYIENQFLWSPQIVDLLAEKLSDPPSDDFRLLLVLPSAPTTGKDDTRGQLAVLAEADDGAGRFLACSLYARSGARADPIYVHAKVAVVDDRWVTVGSANLNNHSLFNDSEVNVIACDPELARTTRWRLWSEHLELPLEEVSGDPTVLFEDRWQPIAKEQRARKEAGLPLTHRLVALPHVSKRSKRLLGPLQSLLVDG